MILLKNPSRRILFSLIFIFVSFTFTLYSQWVQTNGPANGQIMALARSDSVIYAGTANYSNSQGVFITTNNGLNWIQTSLNNKYILSLSASGQYVFAGTSVFTPDSGIYRSTNYGQTWSMSYPAFASYSFLSFNLGGTPFLFSGKNGIILSTDNGVTWNTKSTYCSYIDAFAKSSNHIYEGLIIFGCGVTMSTIYGDSCVPIGLSNHSVYSLVVNESTLFAGTEAGVYLTSNNGQNWTQTPLNNYAVYSLANNGKNIFAGTGGGGVFLSTNNGISWIQNNGGMGNQTIRALLISTNNIFAGADNGFVYRCSLL